jgi:menaquinone-specific isochorismate synthase
MIMPVFAKPVFEKPLLASATADRLADLLAESYLAFLNHRHPRIIGIRFPIAAFNPLAILQQFQAAYHHHFYFEHEADCFVALGKAIQLTVESRDRFAQTRDLIADLSGQILAVDPIGQAVPGCSRFFCNFAFFAQGESSVNCASPAAILLPRWQIEQQTDAAGRVTAWAIVHLVLHPEFMPETESQRIWQELAMIRSTPVAAPPVTSPIAAVVSDDAPWGFALGVQRALQSIAAGQFDKIVLAKALDITANQPFNLIGSLQNLRDRYPNCYRFSASCGNGETFIGASPERLVAVHDRQLKTEALAGSAPRGATIVEDEGFAAQLLDSDKEAREHQLVIDFITQRLASLDIQAQLAEPRLLRLPNIQHRHTPITATMPAQGHILDVVGGLHPTPAVAGWPRAIACQHIPQYEDFDRGWYAAPIGWVDTQGNGEFAVGIRSALLKGNQARLFAGAGIVAGSDPERELNEVQMKLQALLQALV